MILFLTTGNTGAKEKNRLSTVVAISVLRVNKYISVCYVHDLMFPYKKNFLNYATCQTGLCVGENYSYISRSIFIKFNISPEKYHGIS